METAVQYDGVYKRISDLPPAVRHALKDLPHALDTWRKAYNSAASSGNYKAKSAAYQIAWAAVQHRYEKVKGVWKEKKNWKPAKDCLELPDGAFRIPDLSTLADKLEVYEQANVDYPLVRDHLHERAVFLTTV